jgi:hypothetical protein
MHDLMAHIDRRLVQIQCTLDDLDGPYNASAEATRLGKNYLQRRSPPSISIYAKTTSTFCFSTSDPW